MRTLPSDDAARGAPAPRIVLVAQEPPLRKPDSAGAGYLRDLVDLLVERGADVAVIVPETDTARRAETDAAGYALILVPAAPAPSGLPSRAHAIGVRLAPIRPPRGFLAALRRDPAVRAVLRHADIVDVQWPTMTAALPALRRLAPSARLIATMHDVASQGLRRQRERARTPRSWARFLVSAAQARAVEVRTTALADTVIVFSDKDRALLPQTERVEVVDPPLGLTTTSDAAAAPSAREALFVGPMYRGENREALRWFADDIWPRVRASAPDARLVVAGRATEAQRAAYAEVPGIEFLGFVEDLEPVYARAAAVIAPLQVGAGVKFKVVEALVRGVPVIGTSVAFEGIGDDARRPRAHDDAAGFALALVEALQDPAAARAGALAWRTWSVQHYSPDAFARRIAGIYALAPSPAAAEPEDLPARASVVIPVRDGAHGIARQLSALSRQDQAALLDVIVADNGSTDRTAEVALAYRPCFRDLRIVDAGARPGVNHARNAGLRAARTDAVLFCDHDDEVHPGWATALIAALDGADVAGGRLLLTTEGAQATGEVGALPTALGYLPYAVGANLAVDRSAALAIGGFDESFLRGHDEVDFCWRLQEAGSGIAFAPDATVSYHQRRRVRDRARQSYHSARTSVLLWTRHHDLGRLRLPSWRRSVLHALGSIRYLPGLLSTLRRDESARALGWVWGTLDGQLRYRVLGSPPPPQLIAARDEGAAL